MKNDKDINSIYVEMARLIAYYSALYGERKHSNKRQIQNGRRILKAIGVK